MHNYPLPLCSVCGVSLSISQGAAYGVKGDQSQILRLRGMGTSPATFTNSKRSILHVYD